MYNDRLLLLYKVIFEMPLLVDIIGVFKLTNVLTSVSHSIVDWGYLCKYNSSKKGLLSKTVKFYVTADERFVFIVEYYYSITIHLS